MNYRIYSFSENTLVLQMSPEISESQIRVLYALKAALTHLRHPAFHEIMVTFHELTIIFDSSRASFEEMKAIMEQQITESKMEQQTSPASRTILVPVCYDEDMALDKDHMVNRTGLPFSRITELHQQGDYVVYMLGFLPGFLYLGGLDPRLSCPRLNIPRPRIESGSVGIADTQTGIYPMPSPGGWNIIGRTPLSVFEFSRTSTTEHPEDSTVSSSFIQPLDRIKFTGISRREYDKFLGWSIAEYQEIHQNDF